MQISISQIDTPLRKRKVSLSKVQELSKSIEELGLLNPITVQEANGRYRLVAGLHRLEACILLRKEHIEVTLFNGDALMTELAEIDENLMRSELSALDNSLHIARRKEIYEELHPETRNGAIGRNHLFQDRQDVEAEKTERFTESTAKIMGVNERTIQRQAKIGEALADVADSIRGTVIEDNQSELLKLARMSHEEREAEVKAIVQGVSTKVGMPHVANNSGENEWYTPIEYIESARAVLGIIDLDPASSERANKTVMASNFYSVENDGLTKKWQGKVWMNPPYSSDLIKKFSAKFSEHFTDGDIDEGIILVNNATETTWFNLLVKVSSAIVFPSSRIKFIDKNDKPTGAPLQGQAVIYAGNNPELFMKHFSKFGWGATVCHVVK